MNQQERTELKRKLRSLKPISRRMTKKERIEAFTNMVKKNNDTLKDLMKGIG